MSTKVKPAVILVHGAWHVPEHYKDFIHLLQQDGFEVYCPLLPTCDEGKRSKADLFADAQAVRDQILTLIEDHREIIMLLHSYGGAVGTEAVKNLSKKERATQDLPGGVVHLIYMCGFMLQVGESVGGASLPRPVPDPVALDETTGTTSICVPQIPLFYADVEPERAEKMKDLLVPQSAVAMTDAITYAAWQHIPTTYLRTEEDEVLFPYWQDSQIKAVEEAGTALVVKTFKASHSPFLSLPAEMVAEVRAVAKQ